MRILLYGYYKMGNFGDNVFQYIFEHYFQSKNIEYIVVNPNTLIEYCKKNKQKHHNKLFKSGSFALNKDIQHLIHLNVIDLSEFKFDVIFIGGGEVINSYFMVPLFEYIKLNNLNSIPIYGASIGFDINKSNKYIKFFDKCIFRNKVNLIDNINYYYNNDIVFGLNKFTNIDVYKNNIQIQPKTIGYYLIDNIIKSKYNILVEYTNNIKNTYFIKFVIFDSVLDENIINKLINDCNLTEEQYKIYKYTDIFDIIKEILSSEKHLCIRFHAHVICYIYKLLFISFPLSTKTLEFDKIHNISYTFDIPNLISNTYNTPNIKFEDKNFDFGILDLFFISTISNTTFKMLSIWSIINEIYTNFLIILNNKYKIIIDDYINYTVDQIELNILGYINSIYRYGIIEQLHELCIDKKIPDEEIQQKIITLMTNLIK